MHIENQSQTNTNTQDRDAAIQIINNQLTETTDMQANTMQAVQNDEAQGDDNFIGTSSYAPEDNKLRLYPFARLDAATYERVKEAGFKWAPRQELFVAPMWTPSRNDLLLELCGEVGDEDKSLAERAAERAERMTDYSSKRAAEANSARAAVSAIADNIPFGQPILIGHHSERRARKDAERIQNGMRRAVNLWETANYWQERAEGALAHAKYKELPGVRHRRIKGLEADLRKQERNKNDAAKWLKLWLECEAEQNAEQQTAKALNIAGACWLHMPRKEGDRPDFNQCPTAYDVLRNTYPTLYTPRTLAEVLTVAKRAYPATIAHCDRWIAHFTNRITYERAMLGETGAVKAAGFDIQPGGRVLIRGEWVVVLRVNKKGDAINSVTTNCRYVPVRDIGEVQGYMAPTTEEAAKVKAATTRGPLCNYPGEGFVHMTKAQWDELPKDYRGFRNIAPTDVHAAHRVRRALGTFVRRALGDAAPQGDANKWHSYLNIYITDAKRVDPPAAPLSPAEPVTFARIMETPAAPAAAPAEVAAPVAENDAEAFQTLRDQLKAGVQVVSAPQLFPTPTPTADRMAEEAGIEDGDTVADFSAGTGRLLLAARKANPSTIRTGVEINGALCAELRRVDPEASIHHADFMEWDNGQKFRAILLNPPFANGQDIEHIKRARGFLAPGGRLVAICANGPRQNAQLRPLVEECGGLWEALPANTFAESGTGVNTVLLTLTA